MNRKNDLDTRVVDESHKQSLMQQGAKHYKAKQYAEALNYYKEAIQLDPNDASALSEFGSLTSCGVASEGSLFPFSASFLRQISQRVRQDIRETRQEMSENGRISSTSLISL